MIVKEMRRFDQLDLLINISYPIIKINKNHGFVFDQKSPIFLIV